MADNAFYSPTVHAASLAALGNLRVAVFVYPLFVGDEIEAQEDTVRIHYRSKIQDKNFVD